MARILSNPTIQLALAAAVKNEMTEISRAAASPIGFNYNPVIATGTGSGQADRGVEYSGVIEDGNTLVIDLSSWTGIDFGAGDGRDSVGQLIYPTLQIVAIAISNLNDVDTDGFLEIEPDVTEGWTPIGIHTVATEGALPGLGCLIKANVGLNAFVITEGVSSRVALTATGGDVSFLFVVYGRSVAAPSTSSSSSSSSSGL